MLFNKISSPGKLGDGLTLEAALRDARSATQRDARLCAIAALGEASAGDDRDGAERAGRLLRQLLGDDADSEIRQAAALACGELGDRRALELLRVIAGSDPSPAARQGAVIALGRLGDGRDAQIVAAALEDADADVRFQAVGAIAELATNAPAARDVAETALPARLADEDAEVRGSAAAAIGDLELGSAKDALVALLDDSERATRLEAAVALSRLDDPRGAAVLADNVGRRDVGLLAAEALYRRPHPDARDALLAA
ncbi:MAG: HEAT repeat domain-containing protein, partial [Myxococcales bacterium]|nr:HEAT repeat domain-containing protein [Myxococcales bacterium]